MGSPSRAQKPHRSGLTPSFLPVISHYFSFYFDHDLRRAINLNVKMAINNTVDIVSMELLAAVLMGNGASICRSPRQPLLTCMQIPEEQFPWIPPHERKNPVAAV